MFVETLKNVLNGSIHDVFHKAIRIFLIKIGVLGV